MRRFVIRAVLSFVLAFVILLVAAATVVGWPDEEPHTTWTVGNYR